MTVMAVSGIICALVLLSILRGYVLSILWGWFVVPVFHAPALVIPEALGLSTLILMLTYEYSEQKKEDWGAQFMAGAIMPFVALGFGWIYKQFL